jgi:hypothetical protein
MGFTSAKWYPIAQSDRLCRSSQAVSVVGQKAYIFGGELHPRSPVGNRIDIVDFERDEGKKGDILLHNTIKGTNDRYI